MFIHYDPLPVSCSVSATGGIGYSRRGRLIDSRRSLCLRNAIVVAGEQHKLDIARYRRQRAAEMDARAASRQQSAARLSAPAARRRGGRTTVVRVMCPALSAAR